MLKNFRALQIRARHQVYTLLSGNNLSKLHGEGYDLSELREYQPGDDVRKINWIITAKQGKPYVKELHANRELSVVIAAMMGGSLWFGDRSCHPAGIRCPSKWRSFHGNILPKTPHFISVTDQTALSYRNVCQKSL